MKSNIERMKAGLLYDPTDPEIIKIQASHLDNIYEYNRIRPSNVKAREAKLKEMLSEMGHGCYIEAPFYANFGGSHVHLGNNVYANYNLTLVDDGEIFIGDNTMIAPNVTIDTASHPIEPSLRKRFYQYNLPVHIGKNVWIGANVTILPGVTIGDNTVIGASSTVTNDMPENSVCYGTPCRVIRKISERDRKYYYRNLQIDIPIECETQK